MFQNVFCAERARILRSLATPALCVLLMPTGIRGAAPIITALPTVSTSRLLADDLTPYTVSMTVTDGDGYNDIRCLRVLFNHTESGGDQAKGRGYLAWGKTDADITEYGSTWVIADATGGGRWAYCTDAWGGTTYITPLSAELTVAGKATGGSGSRTVTWTFTVKPAWALNPIINDADGWTADSSLRIGWIDGTAPFDVYRAVCQGYASPPRPPILSNPTATTIDVAIDPADSNLNTYAIRVSPSIGSRMFVQNDGSLGPLPVWNARTTWGTKRITGLMWNTTYTIAARASYNYRTYCPSDWGLAAHASTLAFVPRIDYREGMAFSPWVRGQCPYRSVSTGSSGWDGIWDLSVGSMGRGLAGGLDADTYDWRDIDSGSGWGTPTWSGRFTTLELLQQARDHNNALVITANAFGGGYRDWANPTYPGVFVCQTVNPDGLAADWLRYTNVIVQNYRQGDEAAMTGEDARVYNSISNWGGKPKLLAPTEGAVPRVQYWEIGNEPELGGYGDFLTNHYLSPTDYRERYKLISEAMLVVDPTLKFGPCLINPSDPNSQWLPTLAADPAARIDFVGYHPYYGGIKGAWGTPDAMSEGLRGCKSYLAARSAGIRSILNTYNRTACELMATEWNPVNWDAPGFMQSSQAMALGIAESCFSFAEDGVLAAHFWEQPQTKLGAKGAFAGLQDYMGDVLVTSSTQLGLAPADINWRLYVTRNRSLPGRLVLWGLNFSDSEPVTLNLSLAPCNVRAARLRRYGRPGPDASGGDTSLTHSSGMAWEEQDVTAGFNPAAFDFTMDDAEITLLVLDLTPLPDFDADGDVDGNDMGVFSACFNGSGNAAPAGCRAADLDDDGDVDGVDYAIFAGCFNGSGNPPACS